MKNLLMKRILVAVGTIFLLADLAQAMTLKESIDQAIKTNPTVISYRKKMTAADARLNQAIGSFMPTVQVNGSYGKAYTSPSTVQITTGGVTQNFTFGTDATATNKALQGTFSQPIFVAGLFPGFKIAQKGAEIAKEDYNNIVVDMQFNVTQTYFNVLLAEKSLKLSADLLNMAKSHFDQVNAMLAAGTATKADLLRAEVQVANNEVALTKAKNGLDIAKDAFNNALGRDIETPVALTDVGFTGQLGSVPEYKQLLAMAFDNRPDWKQFVLTTQVGEENVRVAQAAMIPSVMLSGQTGNQGVSYPSYDNNTNAWSVTGAASWTLFNGLSNLNKVKEASANLDAQKANEEQVRNSIALEVRDSFLNLKSAFETIGSSRKAVESGKESYKVSDLRYTSGVGTNLEVIDAQVALNQASVNYLQALFDLEIAKAKLNKVVGKGVL